MNAANPLLARSRAAPPATKPARRRWPGWWPLGTSLGLLLLWELSLDLFGVDAFLLPAPSAICVALFDYVLSPGFWTDLLVTCGEALAGFSIATLVGVTLGILIARSRLFERTVYVYLVAIQAMPKIALAPLFVAWLGFGMESKILVSALMALFPVLVNVVEGLKRCDPGRIDMLRTLSANEWQILRHARLPGALPYLFSGLKIAIVFALTGAIVAEFIGARAGLGLEMIRSNSSLDIARTFAVIFILGAIGLTLHAILDRIARRAVYWTPD